MKTTKKIKVTFEEFGVPENEEYSIFLLIPTKSEGMYELIVNGETHVDENDIPHFGKLILRLTREELVNFLNLIQREIKPSKINEQYLFRDLREVE